MGSKGPATGNSPPEGSGRPDNAGAGRGSAVQGPLQDAKGGPQAASQGGAPRGGSRVEPSHNRERMKQDRGDSKSPRKG